MVRKKKIGLVIAAILSTALLLTACGEKKNQNSLERVKENNKLTVVGSGGYRPFNYIDDNGEVIGFDVDTGAEIAKRLGVELDYVTSDWDGLIDGLKSKRYDGILGSMAIKPERLEQVNFTTPYYYSGAQLVVRTDSGIAEPADMSGKTIAVATGTTFVEDAEALGATVSYYQDDNATMMELISGRVDGVITDRLVALETMNGISGGDELMLCGEILRLEEMAIAINKDDAELLEEINKILQEMHDDGTLTEISEKWMNGEDITKK
ncbi:MAG: transporter substrate-binding domain-containing protein [Oscillospiraceae bacterium]|jgi:polar amino acid transport system substrate-binding protein